MIEILIYFSGDKHDAFLDGALSVISGDGKAKDTPKDVGFGYDFWVTNLAGEENESVTYVFPSQYIFRH